MDGSARGTDPTPTIGNIYIVNTGIKGRVRSSIIQIPGHILHNCYPYPTRIHKG
jgi:hypothetical protein